jgi:hypothetical protein
VVSTVAFFASALFNRREGAFKERIEHLEHDLRTPAYAPPGTKLDLRGFRAYNLAGRIAMGIGGFLLLVAIPTFDEGGELNLIAGVLALALGWLIVVTTRRYERRYRARNAEATQVGA